MRAKIILVLLCLTPMILSKVRRYSRLQTDPLSKTRCDLVCYDARKEDKVQCRSTCRSQERKPGTCPSTDHPRWVASCIEACNSDAQCDGIERCCRHGCSSTCSEPIDLLTLAGLPALPTLNEIKERRRSVIIQWTDGVGDAARTVPGRVLYLLEEQHHLGPKYEEAGLGDWNLLMRTNKTKVSLRNHLKPGRWYRFRVAAVSASGTRGFSEPSSPFTPRKGPRPPPAPKKLKVQRISSENGNVTIKLEWKEPRSDLPIMRYKVFWSRRVRGLGRELDSVLVNHQSVPKEQTYVIIKDLQPNSMYFLQVQSISQYGLGKLRSEKAAIFYNTTNVNDDRPPEPLRKNEKEKKIKNLKLNKIIWVDHKLKAKISWESNLKNNDKSKRYFVHWKTIKCQNPHKQIKDLLAITEETSFDIYELDYNCSYLVSINKTRNAKIDDANIVITVPDCEYFKRKVNSTVIRCNS
ncbi:PREDICTED: anosmin-1 [Papilio polytes]|uniref:anosmin-1 n=1 Tax=Papilio polytes TaxID=76194 RepID=UPI000675EB97|nr:PREDICTED: anosmin-1 [Papilio polytes]XP_013142354.1 PREDICTED: anosmin-1 [Papilio polytes]